MNDGIKKKDSGMTGIKSPFRAWRRYRVDKCRPSRFPLVSCPLSLSPLSFSIFSDLLATLIGRPRFFLGVLSK